MTKKPRSASRARAGRGRHPRIIPPPLAGISHVEPCELINADDLRSLATKTGLETNLADEELAALAGRLNFSLSMGFVGQRRNDRATATTGEVLRWSLGLRHVASQQNLGLGYGGDAGEDHLFSAARYLAHAFGHDSTPEALRDLVRGAAERLGVPPGASPAELVRVALDRSANANLVVELLAGRLAAIAETAPPSKPVADEAVAELFDDLLEVFEATYGRTFTVQSHARRKKVTDDPREQRPAGAVLTWLQELFCLAADRAAQRGIGAAEVAELRDWAKQHPAGVFIAVHAARARCRPRKMQRKK